MTRSLLHALALTGVVAVAMLATATTAGAHSALIASDPANGEVLDRAPDGLKLTYSEPPDPELSWVRVYDSAGEKLDAGPPDPDPETGAFITVDLPPLDDGVYTVSWQALSAVDGHITTGAFTFGIGDVDLYDPEVAAPALGDTDTGHRPSAGAITGRWILYWGLALLLGWSVAVLTVFRHDGLPWARWLLVGCWLLAVGGLGLLAAAEAASAGVSLWRFLGSATGIRLVRIAAVLALAGVAVGVAAWRRSRPAAVAVAALTAMAMFGHAMAGHAGAPTDLRWLNLLAQWLHLLGVGAWIGGLVWLLPGLRGRPGPERTSAIARFSRLATVALGLVVITGTVRAVTGIGTIEQLWESDYGVALLIKLAILVPLVGLGAVNRFRNVPALRRGEDRTGPMRLSVRGELLFAASAFAITGALAGLPPPTDEAALTEHPAHKEPAFDDHTDRVLVEGSDAATSIRVTLELAPGHVGHNRFRVLVIDYDTGEIIDTDRVALEFTVPDQRDIGPSRMELEPAAEGWWHGEGTTIAMPAHWRATAIIAYGHEGRAVQLDFEIEMPPDDAGHDDSEHDDHTGHG